MDLTNTLFLIIATSIVSVTAFQNQEIFNKLKFNPYMVVQKRQYGRLFFHGLIHSGWIHLAVNMYVLWSFGNAVESIFSDPLVFGDMARYGKFLYVLMYILALPAASLPSLLSRKNDISYNAVGASGAVSAVVFSAILFAPKSTIVIIFFPFLDIPAYILGAAYLIYSYIMSKRGSQGIAHDAHFAGAVFGFIFPILLNPLLFMHFIKTIF